MLGKRGELVVATYLQTRGWQVLARNWSCRWGELDIVAQGDQWLAFVEVKTRSSKNWDADGLLAIVPSKQAKIIKSAQMFLQAHPHLAELPCRFDVALVKFPDYGVTYLESAFSP